MKEFGSPSSLAAAARHWYEAGFKVIPIVPAKKVPAVRWDPWLENLSKKTIASYWAQHPNHEVGFIVSDGLLVLDADGPAATEAIARLEAKFGLVSNLVIATRRGQHHYYRRRHGTVAKSSSHSTDAHPERIDVKTGRALVVLPPSTGKVVARCDIATVADLVEVDQGFIDAVFKHNGMQAPCERPTRESIPHKPPADLSESLGQLEALLAHIDPGCGYEDWFNVLAALHYETRGHEAGLEVADRWSGGGNNYKGTQEIRAKWASLEGYNGKPITRATLHSMLADRGLDWIEVCADAEPQFEVLETKTVVTQPDREQPPAPATGLDQYSLRGRSSELERLAIDSVYVLGQLALLGQATAIYAAPNTGKTLMLFYLLIETVQAGLIDPDRLYVLDMDDTHKGIVDKTRLGDEHGFHILAEGHRDFSAVKFLDEIHSMIENKEARGVIVVLDTLKKFVNLMDKSQASSFTKVIRRFVMHGGTVIALAHTNKKAGRDGKPVYGGTSDIVDDFDCAYTISMVTDRDEAGYKVVEFENFKRRGNVVDSAAYRYDATPHDSYLELLLSVEPVDRMQLAPIKQLEQQRTDAEIIERVRQSIRDGITTRMKLARAVMQHTKASRRAVLAVLDRYGDEHSGRQWWRYSIGARGACVYELLEPPADGTTESTTDSED